MAGFIPRKSAAYEVFFSNLIQYVELQCAGDSPRWTHIPLAARTAIAGEYEAWYAAYAVTFAPCTPPQKAEKRRLQYLTDKALRVFINAYLRYHPDVTDEDRQNMGIHVPAGTRTPAKPPREGPSCAVVQRGPRLLGINYWFGTGRKGSKPPGVEGARIYYGVFDKAPEDMIFPKSVWATRCPHTISFRETDRGRRAWFALKWEIRRGGEKGESGWSGLQSEIIP
jgi:hypothetical protein